MVPNRSGSAPPSIEGSYLSVNSLIYQQNSNLGNLSSAVQISDSEKQSYSTHYKLHVNPNHRLPTPSISRENHHLGFHIGQFGNNLGLTSVDDKGNCASCSSQVILSRNKAECEDVQSSHQSSNDLVDHTDGFWSAEDASSFVGQTRNLVGFIQEDYPCTPSPVHNLFHSMSSGTMDETVDHDADCSSLHNPPVSSSNSDVSTLNTDRIELSLNADPSTASVSSSSSLNCIGTTQPKQPHCKGNLSRADVGIVDSEMKNLNLSGLHNSKEKKYQYQYQHNYQVNMLQRQVIQQQRNSVQVQNIKSQMGLHGVNSTYSGMDQFLHGPLKFSAEVQPVLQSSGFRPPLYASAAAYVTSSNLFYPNLQHPGFYSTQYGVEGFALNSNVVPQFVSGYPSHGAIPMTFNGPGGPNFNFSPPGASTAGSIGQLGYSVQPPITDRAHMLYYQHPHVLAHNISSQLDPQVASGVVVGSQNSAPDRKKGSELAAGLDDQKLHLQMGVVSSPYPGTGAVISPLNISMQYPPSPHASPFLQGSTVGGSGSCVGRNEIKSPQGIGQYEAVYSGWQCQRGSESSNDTKIYKFLEELKSGKGHRFELSDISGNIIEFSADQHGSRFIQQKLESCSVEEKASVFKEILPFASKLMTDVFGNYVIQKFFEYGTPEQRKELAKQLTGQILPLSLQMYGCRVIQKALEVIELDQKAQLVHELDGHVMHCVRDQNGNHVIQKCIESVPTERIGFIISAFRGHVAALSMHPYGCRVIQRVLEHCTNELQCQFIVDEILESVCVLAQDQYGNYVTQHVLGRGQPQERCRIISKLSGHVVKLSQHKFASNVVEKCLEYGGATEKELIIQEILGKNEEGKDNLLCRHDTTWMRTQNMCPILV